MAFDFSVFGSEALGERYVDWLVKDQAIERVLHYERLWGYYRNDRAGVDGSGDEASGRPYRQGQEYGLPSRITGMEHHFYGGLHDGAMKTGVTRKEIVIENDIGWRVDAMADFLFGKPVGVVSRVNDATRAREIEALLDGVLSANGGMVFLQELALLGSVYGFVDVVMRLPSGPGAAARNGKFSEALRWCRQIVLEPLEASRSVPILDEHDYRKLRFFVQHYWQLHNCLAEQTELVETRNHRGKDGVRQKQTHNVEVLGPDWWQIYEDDRLQAEGANPLGAVPVVHIQNMAKPHHYEGQSDVEPLMALQDELNTRLSDRANRITLQSFKMYLGKGIEGFEDRLVAPGRMWSTENPDAQIDEFGGDQACPSEDAHINEIREAIDKASGVASVAAGILKGRVGNLTSAVALKVTLMGLLAKTERKRLSYGNGIKDICRLVLLGMDKLGVYTTSEEEREVDLVWPSPLPENQTEKLQEALMKQQVGVASEEILKELGYE